MNPAPAFLELFLFTVDPALASDAAAAGIDALVVDWEWRGKEERQRGADTEINRDTAQHLAALALFESLKRCCRINAFGKSTAGEVELAIDSAATDILLPMVRRPNEVEGFLRLVDGRARAGILVETVEAVERAEELARLPLDLVYVGLNDLAIERGHRDLFLPLIDGTLDRLRETLAEPAFGFGGLTVRDKGTPVPCRLLHAEMARLGCDFAFLRRSFKRDVSGFPLAREVTRLRADWGALARRSASETARDHQELRSFLGTLYGRPADGGS